MDTKLKKSNEDLKLLIIIFLIACSCISVLIFGFQFINQRAWKINDPNAFIASEQYYDEFENMTKSIEYAVYKPYVERINYSNTDESTTKVTDLDKKEIKNDIKTVLSAWDSYNLIYYIIDNNTGEIYTNNENYTSFEEFQKQFNKSDDAYSYALFSYPNSFIENKSSVYSTQEAYSAWNELDFTEQEQIKPATGAIVLNESFKEGSLFANLKNEFYDNLKIIIVSFIISIIALVFCLILAKKYIKTHDVDFLFSKKTALFFNKVPLEVRVIGIIISLYLLINSSDIFSFILCLIILYIFLCAVIYDRENLFAKSFYNDVKAFNSANNIELYFAQKINKIYKRMVMQGVLSYFACAVIILFAVGLGSIGFPVLMLLLITVYFVYCMYRLYRYNTIQIKDIEKIYEYTKILKNGEFNQKLYLSHNSPYIEIQNNLNAIGDSIKNSIEKQVSSEKMKSDLVTNVSHDLKTPLTSIINYVDLIKKENIKNKKVIDYLNILDKKSQKLKGLVEDVFDISKATSHSMNLNITKINLKSIINQTVSEYEKEFSENKLNLKLDVEKDVYIKTDGEKLGRILENLIQNAVKYSLEGTNVYIDLIKNQDGDIKRQNYNQTKIIISNIANYEMDFTPEEIITRFTRADKARDLEGFGLGLSIVSSFADVLGIDFYVKIDKDLFKACLTFDEIKEVKEI